MQSGDEMKKAILLALIWCIFLSIPTEAKKKDYTYTIIYDSNDTQLVEIKEEIVELTQAYFDNVDWASTEILFRNDLSELETETRHAEYKNGNLKFILGDGQGERITGNFTKNSYCIEEVKPVSLFQKWFQW